MSTDTRQALAALLPCPFCGHSNGLVVANENPMDLSGGYFIACPSCDASTGLRFACGEDPIPLLIEQWNRRASLSAHPVAGAVAPTADEVRRAAFELCEFIEDIKDKPTDSQEVERFKAGQRYAAKSIRRGLGIWFVDEENSRKTAQAAPAPEPSAQAKKLVSNFARACVYGSDDERIAAGNALELALAAAPHPEPSAQGDPVACVTEEMVTAYLTANDAYWQRIDGEPTKLGKWRNGTPSEATRVSLEAALAAASARA